MSGRSSVALRENPAIFLLRENNRFFEPIWTLKMVVGRARTWVPIEGSKPEDGKGTYRYCGVDWDLRPNIHRPPRFGHESDDENHECHNIIEQNFGNAQFEPSIFKRYLLPTIAPPVIQALTITPEEIMNLGKQERVLDLRALLCITTDECERQVPEADAKAKVYAAFLYV